MGVLKGVLGWILGDDPAQVEMEALPADSASVAGEVPIFLSASDLRSSVPAEYLRADAPFSSEDIKISSSEFLDFSPQGPLRIPAFKLALWCPAFVSIPGGMKGDEVVEFPESVLLRSVVLRDPAGGEVDAEVLNSGGVGKSSFIPLRRGTPGTGDALSDEFGNPFADADEGSVVLGGEELEETRKALQQTILDADSEKEGVSFSEVLIRESKSHVKQDSLVDSLRSESPSEKEEVKRSPESPRGGGAMGKERPQMSNVHRIMRAYLQDGSAPLLNLASVEHAVASPEATPLPTERFSATSTVSDHEESVEKIVQTERNIREKSSELLRSVSEKASETFKRLERALSGYPTVTGVSVRIPEGDFSSGDTSGYVSAGEASEEIRRAFSLTGSMSIRGEAVTCLTVFNETDAVTVLCTRSAQISVMHGAEGLPLAARRVASRWLSEVSS